MKRLKPVPRSLWRLFDGRMWLAVLLLICPLPIQANETVIDMQVGELQVLDISDVARVAVGNSRYVNAVTTEEKEVIVFARQPGRTSVQVWSADGKRQRYVVNVAEQGAKQTRQALHDLLARMPNVRLSTVGEKLVIEGEDISDADRERLAMLSKQYPQMLDFTGQVGWDRMVLLDVQVVEVPRSRLRELGVRWDTQSQGGLTAGLAWDGGTRRWEQRPGTADGTVSAMPMAQIVSTAAGYLGINAVLSAQIQAMAQSGEAVVLAQPQLVARSGATAEFLAGGEVPYATTDSQGNTQTAFKPYGVSLRITPQVESNGAVRSRIEVEVSSIDSAVSVPTGPALKTRRASTEFNAHSGQTLVLAGFVSREHARNVDQVPGLGDIPLLGRLFRSEREQRGDTELAIFVTPVVVSAEHPDFQQRVQLGSEIVQSAFPEPALLNVPVKSGGSLPQPVPDTFLQGVFATDLPDDGWPPQTARLGSNTYRFKE
ncbi:type II and III secretion system protein family protein [Mesopusillimonas faecipullorum]|nr:pilus assembly protein N-terminal domain-containing protein [Mesopusillimonas faecipullorum]